MKRSNPLLALQLMKQSTCATLPCSPTTAKTVVLAPGPSCTLLSTTLLWRRLLKGQRKGSWETHSMRLHSRGLRSVGIGVFHSWKVYGNYFLFISFLKFCDFHAMKAILRYSASLNSNCRMPGLL